MPGVSVRMPNGPLAFWLLHTELMISENHQRLPGLFPELYRPVANSASHSRVWRQLEEWLVQPAVAASWSRDLTKELYTGVENSETT